mgnify:CR=1 FL=1
MIDLRLGRWQDALADVEQVDAVIVDAPYSARTHGGHDGQSSEDEADRRSIDYTGHTVEDVREVVASWVPRTRGWFVTITDHILAAEYERALADAGRYVFAPLPWYAPGSRVRLAGDGPSSWTCWVVVARPRRGQHRDGTSWSKWGTLPGGYHISSDRRSVVVGAKPLGLMRALVRDYTRPGDLVCDPCAGGGTTARACQLEGRRFVGAEVDPDTHRAASQRLAQPYTAPLFGDEEQPAQVDLLA